MDYFEWNKVIARHFFNEEMSGREVLLYVNEKLIQKLGAPSNAGVDDFIKAAKTGTHWATRSGFCQKALQTCEDWRSWKASSDVYPPYIVYLACFVLAAGVEGDFAPHAYYARLRKLLGEPEHNGMYPSFEKMISLWDDLEKWSKEDQHERFGRFEARIRGSWINVGLPLSQTLLSEDERKSLPNLFDEAGLDPTNAPSPEIMPRILQAYGRDFFEKRTLRVLNGTSQEDAILREALVGFILDELEVWDGTIIQEVEEQGAASSRVQTGLRICLLFDDVARSVNCYFRFKTRKVFPEDGLSFEQSGNSHVWSCTEAHQGWSRPLKDIQVSPPQVLDAASVDWEEGLQFTDNENHWRARLKAATVRLFLLGQREGLPDWIESERLEKGVQFLVACCGADIEKVRQWGTSSCEKFAQKQASGLPFGWLLFEGNNATQSCNGINILSISSSLRLRIKGIKISGNAYLKSPFPEIVLENSSANETVTLNGTALKQLEQNIPVWQLPENTPVNETLKVEVKAGDQTLRSIVLRLEEPSLPLSFNQTVYRDSSGKIHTDGTAAVKIYGVIADLNQSDNQPPVYPQTLPTHLSERIIFIGEYPGQIADWPREALPSEWHPIWALAKKGRSDWESHFCGKPGQTANCKSDLYGTPSDRKRWREALWIYRKITKQPSLAQLRSIWAGYVRMAENV